MARSQRLPDEGVRRLEAVLGDDPEDAHAEFHLARMLFDSGRMSRAAEHFERAAAGLQRQGDGAYEAYARINLAECRRLTGDHGAAMSELERAALAAERSANPQLAVHTRLRALGLERSRGRDLEGVRLALQAMEEAVFGEAGGLDYGVQKSWLFEMSGVLLDLHRLEEAFAVNLRWSEEAAEQADAGGEAIARVNLAAISSEMSWRSDAGARTLRLARDGLDHAEAAGDAHAKAEALRLLGKLLPGAEGRAYLQRCLAEMPEKTPARTLCEFALAGSLAEDDPASATDLLDEAWAHAGDSQDPWTPIYSWGEHFRVVWTTLPREQALAGSLLVLDRIEELRRLQGSDSGRVEVFASVAEIYRALTGYLLDAPGGPTRTDLEDAFAVSERLRARVLLDGLRAADVPDGREILPDAGQFASLADLESTLGDDEAAMLFQIAPERDVFGKQAGGSWLMVATRDGTRVYDLPDGSEVENMVAMLMGLLEDGSLRDDGGDVQIIEDVSRALADRLFAEARADLPPGVDSWILVPDGLLHLVPFPELAPGRRLSIVPSVTLWRRWRESSESTRPAALAFADPAPGPEFGSEGRAAGQRLADLESAAELGPLPYARREGRRLVRRLGGSSRLLEASEATEEALKGARLGDYGILHFATHALLDPQRPHRSAIVLAPGGSEATGSNEDGLLQPREIASLDLGGKLVVLSACRSASGRTQHGEGVDSLARAFFQAGARTVVASLWRLRDDHAAAYFDAFYRHLADGRTVSAASAATAHELRVAGAEPAAWAGVVVLGDGVWTPVPGGTRSALWFDPSTPWVVGLLGVVLAVLAAAVAVALGAATRRRRRKLRP